VERELRDLLSNTLRERVELLSLEELQCLCQEVGKLTASRRKKAVMPQLPKERGNMREEGRGKEEGKDG
jgi:hypothetical protein